MFTIANLILGLVLGISPATLNLMSSGASLLSSVIN